MLIFGFSFLFFCIGIGTPDWHHVDVNAPFPIYGRTGAVEVGSSLILLLNVSCFCENSLINLDHKKDVNLCQCYSIHLILVQKAQMEKLVLILQTIQQMHSRLRLKLFVRLVFWVCYSFLFET